MSGQDASGVLVSRAAPSRSRSPLARSIGRWIQDLAGALVGLVLVMALFHYQRPDVFLSVMNVKMVLAQTVVIGTAAMGMTFIMVSGGIDLSVGSVMALSGVTTALLLKAEWNPWLATGAGALTGAACGAANAAMVTGLRIVPFIATLGMWGIARGLAKALGHNNVVRPLEFVDPLNAWVLPLRSTAWWDFAPAVWVMFALAILLAIVLHATVLGRHTYAIGSNETASRLSGIRISRSKIYIYSISGLLTGLAGVFYLARVKEADPQAAIGIELQVIAAVVIGGGSLFGGEGGLLGTLVGALMLTSLVNGCDLAGWPNWVQEIIIGAIIVLAVALDQWRRRRQRAT